MAGKREIKSNKILKIAEIYEKTQNNSFKLNYYLLLSISKILIVENLNFLFCISLFVFMILFI